jgi:glycosidase
MIGKRKYDMEEVKFEINHELDVDDWHKYSVILKVPMSMGFITEPRITMGERFYGLSHIKNEDGYAYFSKDIYLRTGAIYNYYFSFKVNNETKTVMDNGHPYKLSAGFDVPDWAKGKIMYHIFVDRFNKSEDTVMTPMPNRVVHNDWHEDIVIGPNENGLWCTDYYGGNLKGIIEKLDYIKSFGVSILYLSPIVLSQSNHRYDAGDYKEIDPYAGSKEDLKKLCDVAHQKGMKVILDAVFDHTGNDSKYFNEFGNYPNLGAYQSRQSKYYPFYRKYENNDETYFDYWWGFKNMPVCDCNSREWQNYVYGEGGIIDIWFSLGIDGLRLDVANELSDEFIAGIRTACKRNKEDSFILGEIWNNPMRNCRGYISNGKCMDSVMDYHLMDALIRYYKYAEVYRLIDVLNQLKYEYPDPTLYSLMNATSTHDISRAINLFGSNDFIRSHDKPVWELNNDKEWQKNYKLTEEEYKRARKIFKAYTLSLAMLPGNLSIFYGDEIGLQGMGDLAARRPFTWDNMDYNLVNYFKGIGVLRNKNKFLEQAKLNVLDINDKYMMFERETDTDKALTLVNRTADSRKIPYPEEYIGSKEIFNLNNTHGNLVKPYGGLVLKRKKH